MYETMLLKDNHELVIAMVALVNRQAGFELTPLPERIWRIKFKANEGHRQALARILGFERR